MFVTFPCRNYVAPHDFDKTLFCTVYLGTGDQNNDWYWPCSCFCFSVLFCFVLCCFVFLVIRTSIFRVKPGLFLFSGLFQPGNVLSYALIFQWRKSDNFLKLHTDLMTGVMYYWRHTKGMCRKNKILHALWFLVGYYVIQIFWI